jgi:hypothetical protein
MSLWSFITGQPESVEVEEDGVVYEGRITYRGEDENGAYHGIEWDYDESLHGGTVVPAPEPRGFWGKLFG